MRKATTVGTLALTIFRILGGPRARAQDSISQPQVKRQLRVKKETSGWRASRSPRGAPCRCAVSAIVIVMSKLLTRCPAASSGRAHDGQVEGGFSRRVG